MHLTRLVLIFGFIFGFLNGNIKSQTKSFPDEIKNIKTSRNADFRKKMETRRSDFENQLYLSRREFRKRNSKWSRTSKTGNSVKSISLNKTAGVEAISSAEREALIALYNNTDGDNWTNNSGWKTPPLDADGFAVPGTENTWGGIVVNTDHVEGIILPSNNLSGTLPAELGNLSNLVMLFLPENSLTGNIPVEIGNLANLESIILSVNSLSGNIPAGLADPGNLPALGELDLGYNNITGNIPRQLGNLSALIYLYLDNNDLTGVVPAELGNLTNLEELDISRNKLDGVIEPGFADPGDLPALEILDLGVNKLNGNIPAQIGNLNALIYLYLDINELTGSVPAELGNLVNLVELDISENKLDGVIESGIADPGELPNLEILILADNKLTGTIPITLGNLAALVELYLDYNLLTGNIPAELGNLVLLEKFGLSYNELDGIIESGMLDPGDLPNLEYFIIQKNQLSGNIPAGIGNLANLRYFIADNNSFTGSIPSQIGNLGNLLMLYLFHNQLSGPIPAEIGDLSSVSEIDLWDNQLSGSIPSGMFDPGNLPNLVLLNLSTNQLTGSIPSTIANLANIQFLAIVENQLTDIPQEIGNLTTLVMLYLTDNKISAIPAGMLEPGDFPALEFFELSKNEIDGTIPTEFENLASLEELYLSGNKLSGEIPVELMNIANLSNDCLDIRWNSLYTNDSALRTFLDAKQEDGDWESYQTIAPVNLSSFRLNSVSYVSWNPIIYNDDPGGYDVYYSAGSGGPYTYLGSASGKQSSLFGCSGLEKNSSYYFVIKSRTNSHAENNNIITSEYSAEIYIENLNLSFYPEVITNTGATVTEGGEFTFSDLMLKSYDEDADISTLIYDIQTLPQNGSLILDESLFKNESGVSFTQNDIANGKVQYRHNGQDSNSDFFTFIVSDVEGHATDLHTFNITVKGSNDAPVVDTLETITMQEDEVYALSTCNWYEFVSDPDDPDSCLTFYITCRDEKVTVTCTDDTTFIFSPEENYFGNTILDVTISDGELECSTTVALVIESVNDLPVITGLPATYTVQNGDIEIIELSGLAEDVETPDTLLTWDYSATPDSLNIFYDQIEYAVVFGAKGSFEGDVEMEITVTDEDGGSASETITVTVTPDPSGINDLNGVPTDYELCQNYPNPFNPTTVIRYGIPSADANNASPHVTLKIYDLLGNLVVTLQDGTQSPGYYERTWNAANVSSGIYLYVLSAGNNNENRKMILLK